MSNNKNIDDIVRNSFESVNKNAPDNLWNNLSTKLDLPEIDYEIDTKIKNSF